jgi:hypothetical protein
VKGEDGITHPLENATRSATFYRQMSDDLFHSLTTESISYYHHTWGVSPMFYDRHPELSALMSITALNRDANG